MSELIRVWKEFDAGEISKHLLVVGLLTADCSNCRELGIDYSTAKACPKCGVDFKYIASRGKEIKKIKNRRPDLIFIDFEDYKKTTGEIKAKNFFLK
jgi:NAD(P)H-hydrate repair Nnr-like enzyme with NAD(P)H-hydrate dehydratase domain